MAEPLPPLPPLPALGDTQFAEKLALHNAVAAMYRDAAINAQTLQMADNAAAVRASTAAIQAAQDALPPTKGELFMDLVRLQLDNDKDATVRALVGTGNIAAWAKDLVEKRFEFFPDTQPA